MRNPIISSKTCRKYIVYIILCTFLFSSFAPISSHAQDIKLPAPGTIVHLSPEFNPAILKGIKVHPDNPFKFDFILDKGEAFTNLRSSETARLKEEANKLIRYFLASVTTPERDLWVNLSPYEKDRIIPSSFGLTEMGRDLLAQDYMLKQITASLIYPEDEVGKKFWKRIYEEAAKKYGNTNIPVNTFNKVWIVPEKAVVYENAKAGTAYVVESRLKVMLEEDYLSLAKNKGDSPLENNVKGAVPTTHTLGSQIIREIVIPELTKEVNEGKNFCKLRQVYNSLILATWYKKKIKDSILSKVYADKNKVKGLSFGDSPLENNVKGAVPMTQEARSLTTDKIYQQYIQAFKKGVYNYIKEEVDPLTQQSIPRKYFSGGVSFGRDTTMTGLTGMMQQVSAKEADGAIISEDQAVLIHVGIQMTEQAVVSSNAPKQRDYASVSKANLKAADQAEGFLAQGKDVEAEAVLVLLLDEDSKKFYQERKSKTIEGESIQLEARDLIALARIDFLSSYYLSRVTEHPEYLIPIRRFSSQLIQMGEFAESYFISLDELIWERHGWPYRVNFSGIKGTFLLDERFLDLLAQVAQLYGGIEEIPEKDQREKHRLAIYLLLKLALESDGVKADKEGVEFLIKNKANILSLGPEGMELFIEYAQAFNNIHHRKYEEYPGYVNPVLTDKTLQDILAFKNDSQEIESYLRLVGLYPEAALILFQENAMVRFNLLSKEQKASLSEFIYNNFFRSSQLDVEGIRVVLSQQVIDLYKQFGKELNPLIKMIIQAPHRIDKYINPEFVKRFREMTALGLGKEYAEAIINMGDNADNLMTDDFIQIMKGFTDIGIAKEYLNVVGHEAEYVSKQENVGSRMVPTGKVFHAQTSDPLFIAAFVRMQPAVRKAYVEYIAATWSANRTSLYTVGAVEVVAAIRKPDALGVLCKRAGEPEVSQLLARTEVRARLITALAPANNQTELLTHATASFYAQSNGANLMQRINDGITDPELREELIEAISQNPEFRDYLNTFDNFDFFLRIVRRSNDLAVAYVFLLSKLKKEELHNFRMEYGDILLTENMNFTVEIMEMIRANVSLIGKLNIEKLRDLHQRSGYVGQIYMSHAARHPQILDSVELYNQLLSFIDEDNRQFIAQPSNKFNRVYKKSLREGGYFIEVGKDKQRRPPLGYELAEFLIDISDKLPSLELFKAQLHLFRKIDPEVLVTIGYSFLRYNHSDNTTKTIQWQDNLVVRDEILQALGELNSVELSQFILQGLNRYALIDNVSGIEEFIKILNNPANLRQLNEVSSERLQLILNWNRTGSLVGKGQTKWLLHIYDFTDPDTLMRFIVGPLSQEVLQELLDNKNASGEVSPTEDALLRGLFSSQFIENLEKIQSLFLSSSLPKMLIVKARRGNIDVYKNRNFLEQFTKKVDSLFGEANRARFGQSVDNELLELLENQFDQLADYLKTLEGMVGAEAWAVFLESGQYDLIVKWIKLLKVLSLEGSIDDLKVHLSAISSSNRAEFLTLLTQFRINPLLPAFLHLDVRTMNSWASSPNALKEAFDAFNGLREYGVNLKTAIDFFVFIFKSGQRNLIYRLRSLTNMSVAQRKMFDQVKRMESLTDPIKQLFQKPNEQLSLDEIRGVINNENIDQLAITEDQKESVSYALNLILLNRLINNLLLSGHMDPDQNGGEKKLRAVVECLDFISSIVAKYQNANLAKEVKGEIHLFVEQVIDILQKDFKNQETPDAIEKRYYAFMTNLLKNITGLNDIPGEILRNEITTNQLLIIANLYYALEQHNGGSYADRQKLRDKIKEILKTYLTAKEGRKDAVRKFVLDLAENKKEIERLTSKEIGFDLRLWTEGIDISDEILPATVAQSVEIARASIHQAFHEIVDIIQAMGDTVEEADQQVFSYKDAEEKIRLIKQRLNGRIQNEGLARMDQVLTNIKNIEIKAQEVRTTKKTRVRFVLRKDPLEEMTAGDGVPGCYSPHGGAHQEMPPTHATEANAFFGIIYDEDTGKQIANAVVVLTEKGALVFGQYSNRSDIDLHPTWAKAWQKLAQYAPAVILPPGDNRNVIAGRSFAEKNHIGEESAEAITVTKKSVLYGPMNYDFGLSQANGDWSYTSEKMILIKKSQEAVEEQAEPKPEEVALQVAPVTVAPPVSSSLVLGKSERQQVSQELFNLGVDVDLRPVMTQLNPVIFELTDVQLDQIIDSLKSRQNSGHAASQENKKILRQKLKELIIRFRVNKAIDYLELEIQQRLERAEALSEEDIQNVLYKILTTQFKLNLNEAKSISLQKVMQIKRPKLNEENVRGLHSLLDQFKGVTDIPTDGDISEALFGEYRPSRDRIGVTGELSLINGEVKISLGSRDKHLRIYDQDSIPAGQGVLQFEVYKKDGQVKIEVVDMISKDPRASRSLYLTFESLAQEISNYMKTNISLESETAAFLTRTSLEGDAFETSTRTRDLSQRLGWIQVKQVQSKIKLSWIERVQPLLRRLNIRFEEMRTEGIEQRNFRYYTKEMSPDTEMQAQKKSEKQGRELQESQLAKAQRTGQVTVTLLNSQREQPAITLDIRRNSFDSNLDIFVSIEGESTGYFTLAIEDGLIKTAQMYPLGRENEPSYSKYRGRNITSTILNWLAWEAKQNHWNLRNDGTVNTHLVYLFLKYFGGNKARRVFNAYTQGGIKRPGEIDQDFTFIELVEKYGYYGHQIWRFVFDTRTDAGISLEKIQGSSNFYKIIDFNYKNNQFQIGDIVEIDKNANVSIVKNGGSIVPTDFRINYGGNIIVLQGPPTFSEIPHEDTEMQSQQKPGDKMMGANKQGGIDLTPANMNLQTQNAGGEIKFHMDPAMLAQLQNAPGFTATITDMEPVSDIRTFLGIEAMRK